MVFDETTSVALYTLEERHTTRVARGGADDFSYEALHTCLRSGKHRDTAPVIHVQDRGEVPLVIWVSLVPILHEDLVQALLSASCTGWEPYSVQVFRGGVELAGYAGLSITGRCDFVSIDAEHSEHILKEVGGRSLRYLKGLYVSRKGWDGSDFFMGKNQTEFVVVTHKVVEVLSAFRLPNVKLEPIEDVTLLG